jgi:adenosylcobinamide-phosphate synthase
MALGLLPVIIVTALASSLHPVFVWILEVAALYFTLRFLETTRELAAIEKVLREGSPIEGAIRLGQWRGEPVEGAEGSVVARLAAEHALREAHYGSFGMLFWYLLLPGPIGIVLYPLALRAARAWTPGTDPAERDFAWCANRAFEVIDWIPQRLTACAFAVVGDFEDALYCWRSQAASWEPVGEGIVLASGAGALGVRLGDAVPAGEGFEPRMPLGVGEPAREESLASLEGLLWRAWVLWMILFLLAAALHPA